jgi:hypothetical protein
VRSLADYQRSIDAIIEMEASGHGLSATVAEQAARFAAVCRDAATIEASRRQAGFPEPQPEPWPTSTWQFLAEQTQRARARA